MGDHQDASMDHTDWELPTRDVTAEQGDQDLSSIAKFLERPILINTYVWTVGTMLTQEINPWSYLLGNSAFIDKLNYFKLFRGNLTVTFKINGTPQHAGKVLCSYRYRDRENGYYDASNTAHLITRSQRPHCWLDAADNRTGCICIPWFSPESWLDIPTMYVGDYNADNMGVVNIDSPATLKQSNAGSDTITISVFANFTDVQLSIPTVQVAASSGTYFEPCAKSSKVPKVTSNDEYGSSGVISGPSAVVADIAGKLKDVPVIGIFARATEIGANAVGGIARLFGFSKPRMIDDIKPMRNMPVSNMANVEGMDSVQSLALTAKQELTVDTRTAGFDGEDQLAFKFWKDKMSYLTLVNWQPTDTVNSVIWGTHVNPMLGYRLVEADEVLCVPTALGYMSRPFKYWSGSLRFRFQAIATKFHRGRITIVYDPSGGVTNSSGVYNKTFTHIVDLSEERDFTIEIPWSQAKPYAEVHDSIFSSWLDDPTSGFVNDAFSNGCLYMVVATDLAISDGVTPVDFIVSMSAGPDYEVMGPRDNPLIGWLPYYDPASGSYYEPCSDMETGSPQDDSPEPVTEIIHIGTPNYTPMDYKSSVYFGERIQSARQLMKRYTFYKAFKPLNASSAGSTHSTGAYFIMPSFPAYYGYSANGNELLATGARFNRTGNSFMNYFAMAFAGWRGSVRYKLVASAKREVSQMMVTRATEETIATSWGRAAGTTVLLPASAWEKANSDAWYLQSSGVSGTVLTVNQTMNALEFETPYQQPQRFSPVVLDTTTSDTSAFGDPLKVVYNTDGSFSSTDQIFSYTAAGEDFSLFGFLGAPLFYVYNLQNPPA